MLQLHQKELLPPPCGKGQSVTSDKWMRQQTRAVKLTSKDDILNCPLGFSKP